MNRVLFKISILAITFFTLSANVNAIDNEYKNSLTKIELTKTSENSYNVNLYTSKKFSEPVKIIKKSDLNYYILLPETKNSTSQTSFNTSDIRNVDTKVYQYAGADVNNGYTKINIGTTKPLNFKVSVKSNAQAASKIATETVPNTPKVSLKNTTDNETIKNQKKNLDFQKTKIKEASSKQANKTKPIKNKNNVVVPKTKTKVVSKKETTKEAEPIKKTNVQTNKNNNVINQNKEKISTSLSDVTETKEETKEQLKENEAPSEIEDFTLEEKSIEENPITEENTEVVKEPQKDLYDYLIIIKNKLSTVKQKLVSFKTSFTNKLNEYGLSIKDIILMGIAGIISFFIMLLVLTKKNPQPRLKNKADLLDKNETKNLTPIKLDDNKKQTPNGQYFIFDKNVRQTGFCDPATSAIKRNYELSSYDPDLRDNYKRAEIEPYGDIKGPKTKTQQSEYDIIQKILKEDSFIEIAPQEIEQTKPQVKETKQSVTSPIEKEESKPQLQKQVTETIKEPEVLSNVEIAPERGFMCVSYNDNISLLGYIFDDVFALHNFKTPKLENYNIKFRLSEKTDKTATFIVKIDKTKMLVKVTKSAMTKEVVM